MKKKLILMCIAGALVMTAVIGGTLAGMNAEINEQGVADIEVDDFAIDVTGTGINNGATSEAVSLEAAATPGGTVAIERSITNEGDYDLYARIVINKKWDIDKSAESIELLFDEKLMGNWINPYKETMSLNDEQIILYYALPIAKDGEPVKLPLTGIKFSEALNNDYAGKSVDIDISVDAVQAAVVEDSMLSEWGVFPTINEDGVITGITE